VWDRRVGFLCDSGLKKKKHCSSGIFTADPRKAKLAKLLPTITPEEAAELTYYGSEVVHPFTMEQVIRASIPIRIKNTFKPEGQGTLILPGESPKGSPRSSPTEPNGTVQPRSKHATAVTIKDNVTVVNVHSNRKSVSHGFLAQIFSTLDKYGVVVDLISTSEVHVSMALGPYVTEQKLNKALAELRKYGIVCFFFFFFFWFSLFCSDLLYSTRRLLTKYYVFFA
jgi:aspartate kinase